SEKTALSTLLKRPEIGSAELQQISEQFRNICLQHSIEAVEQAEITLKYQVYIEREEQLAAKISSLEDYKIKSDFDYDRVKALSSEAREKLKRVRPETIGQMSRISGVSPSDVSILTIYLGK
ncbi:MAG: tRNA uridine-5-carboxymethylaminomethyl(34) synthesis enzyme MnmG, partial [Bacteroidota bacterium]